MQGMFNATGNSEKIAFIARVSYGVNTRPWGAWMFRRALRKDASDVSPRE